MNRYRNTPGHRPTQASTTTTCQKCLKKGHYSYECKSSVQSRPYSSRPSRSQQLQNPKLKPQLIETKLDNLDTHTPNTALAESAEVFPDRRDLEPRVKRARYSPAAESNSSVSSISTRRSISPPSAPQTQRRLSSVRHSPSAEPQSDAAKKLGSSPGEREESGVTRKRHLSRDSENRRPYRADLNTRHDRNRAHPRVERSLSPFSKRLALTQAMNN